MKGTVSHSALQIRSMKSSCLGIDNGIFGGWRTEQIDVEIAARDADVPVFLLLTTKVVATLHRRHQQYTMVLSVQHDSHGRCIFFASGFLEHFDHSRLTSASVRALACPNKLRRAPILDTSFCHPSSSHYLIHRRNRTAIFRQIGPEARLHEGA